MTLIKKTYWDKTRTSISKALTNKHVNSKDIETVVDCYDENYDTVFQLISENNESEAEGEYQKPAEKVLELVEPHIGLLFKNELDGSAFARIEVNGRYETLLINKNYRFELLVRKIYYDTTNKSLGRESLKEVVDNLESRALFGDGGSKKLNLRIGTDPDDNLTYWYDLGNENWDAVRITKDGWEIIDSGRVPIMFRRYAGQQAQVYPSKNYPPNILDQFISLLNIKIDPDSGLPDAKTVLLVKCYLILVLIPDIAKAILILHGPPGAAKIRIRRSCKITS